MKVVPLDFVHYVPSKSMWVELLNQLEEYWSQKILYQICDVSYTLVINFYYFFLEYDFGESQDTFWIVFWYDSYESLTII